MTDARVIYTVRDLDLGRSFYRDTLGFAETFVDFDNRWSELTREGMHIALTEGEPGGEEQTGVAMIDVEDIKAEAERLRSQQVNVGVVLELAGQMRLCDVFDPDGNRIQLAQPLD